MTNDLIDPNTLSYEDLAKLTGQSVGGNGPVFPRLGINREGEDEEGNAIPVGTFAFKHKQLGYVYSKTAKFRPFINAYNYGIYDPTGETSNRSIIFRNFKEEIVDERGGIACGKVMGKEKDNLTEAQKETQKKIKCYRLLFGTVSFTGVDAKGNAVEIVDEPVIWRTQGANFMAANAIINDLSNKKKLLPSYQFDLSLTRKKNGATTYYEITVDCDRTNTLALDRATADLLNRFNAVINEENAVVKEKYLQALRGEPTQDDLDDSRDLQEILGDDLDD